MLRSYWPDREKDVVVRDMAPLTRDDVLRAARTKGVPDPDGFVAGLEQRGLVPVASFPVPLTTLLNRAAQGHPFPATGEEVYRLACEQLCEEANRSRRRPHGLGLQEVMRCAGHLAAVLQFCGNGVLTTALAASGNGPVRLVDVAEAGEPGAGGHAEDALSWLTTTPLLRSLAEGQWQFAHQGIQGFLAADYLKDRQLAQANMQSLLFAGPGLTRYVHPSHRDAAGWLAWHSSEVFSEILGHDPVSLLGPDLPAQPAVVRAQVVEALFTAAGHGKEPPAPSVLHRTDHPGLGGQLAARITPAAARQAGAQLQPLELALALARACPDRAPAAELLDVAEDDQVKAAVRVEAVETVPVSAIAAAAGRLAALTASPVAEVSATALLALWPQQLPTLELLTRMPATAPGSYWPRIERRLRAADADDVAAWMRQQLGSDTVAAPAGVLQLLIWMCSLLKPAEGDTPQPSAATQLADALALLLLRSRHLAYEVRFVDASDTWTGNPAWRRLLAGAVIARLTVADTAALAAAMQDPLALLPPDDSIYWARKAAADTTGGLAVLGNPLILTYPGNTPELTGLQEERQDNPRLAELTASWFTHVPVPARAQNAEQLAARHRSEIGTQLESLLAEQPDPNRIRTWWLEVVQLLNRNPERFHRVPVTVHLDLPAAASCPPPDSPLGTALQAAALHALEQAPVMGVGQISTVATFADACEVTALSLLDYPPDLTPERWAGLALVLAFADCGSTDRGTRRNLLVRATIQAGPAFVLALPAALSATSPRWIANVVTALVSDVDLGDQVRQAVLAWTAAPDRPTRAWRDAARALAPSRASRPILAQLAQLADHGFPAGDSDDAQQRWAQALDLLLLYGPPDGISSRWEQILASAEATTAWAAIAEDIGIGFSLFAHGPIHYWPPAYQALTPAQAGQLYDRLAKQHLIDFPRENAVPDIAGPGRRGVHNRLPELLAEHLTEAAALELQYLVKEHPEHCGLPGLTADHARRLSENLRPLTLAEFGALTTDVNRRIVRNITELTRVVLDALDTLQEQALWSHGWSMLMWNRMDEAAKDGWWRRTTCPT